MNKKEALEFEIELMQEIAREYASKIDFYQQRLDHRVSMIEKLMNKLRVEDKI